mgnify:CR=1 FL=1
MGHYFLDTQFTRKSGHWRVETQPDIRQYLNLDLISRWKLCRANSYIWNLICFKIIIFHKVALYFCRLHNGTYTFADGRTYRSTGWIIETGALGNRNWRFVIELCVWCLDVTKNFWTRGGSFLSNFKGLSHQT